MKLLEEAFRITFDDMTADVRVSDVPVILMSKKTFGMIHKELVSVLGRRGKSLLYHAGYEAGRQGVATMKKWWDFRNKDEVIEAYQKKSDDPVCYFTRGYLCGFIEVAFGTEALRCDEVSCEGRGDDHCEFLIKSMFW